MENQSSLSRKQRSPVNAEIGNRILTTYVGRIDGESKTTLEREQGAVKRHDVKSSTCVDQAAQGRLASSDLQACGDQPLREKNI